MLRLSCALAVALLLAGCVNMESVVVVEPPLATTQPLPAAAGSKVSVRVVEGRQVGDDIIGQQLDGYGYARAPIRTARHPREVLQRAAERELAAKGFTVGPGGAVLQLTLREMYAHWRTQSGPQSLTSAIMVGPKETTRHAVMRVNFHAVVLDGSGAQRGEVTAYGESKVNDSRFTPPGMATRPLAEEALQDALGRLLMQSHMMDAIVAANRR
jgi:uncharacterized lipoprotein YajG